MLTTVSHEPPEPTGREKRKKVGYYILGPLLGEGKFAKIRVGTHIISREQVAVKVVSKRVIVQRETARRNFRREALLLQHVSHPHIVRLYEAMETANSYYLVFELAENGGLHRLLNEKKYFTEHEARQYMRQIVSAVDHLHKYNIVHRDLRLENFLLDGAGDIKIVDFGLSVMFQRENSLHTQCGSPAYAAPEIFGNRRYGPPVDVWSLGVCLYSMVVGHLPFHLDPPTNMAQLHALILRGATLPPFLTEALQGLLSGMLEIQESRRLSISEVFSHPWLTCNGFQPLLRQVESSRPSIDAAIINYMTTVVGFNENDVIQSVTEGKLNASSATYHLLKQHMFHRPGGVDSPFVTDRKGVTSGTQDRPPDSWAEFEDTRSSLSQTPNSQTTCDRPSRINTCEGNRKLALSSETGDASNSYKDCIKHLKAVRGNSSNMTMLGKHFAAMPKVDDQNIQTYQSYSVSKNKLPSLNLNKSISKCQPSHSKGTVRNHFAKNGSLNPSTNHNPLKPDKNVVLQPMMQSSTSISERIKVCGKSPFRDNNDSIGDDFYITERKHSLQLAAFLHRELFQDLEADPPPAPPNTAHGDRPVEEHFEGPILDYQPSLDQEGTASSMSNSASQLPLMDASECEKLSLLMQQGLRLANENMTRSHKPQGMSFVAPLSSPKTLTNRYPDSISSRTQNYSVIGSITTNFKKSKHLLHPKNPATHKPTSAPGSPAGSKPHYGESLEHDDLGTPIIRVTITNANNKLL